MIVFLDFDETLVPFRTSEVDIVDSSMRMFPEAKSVVRFLIKNFKVIITSRSRKPNICRDILYSEGFDPDTDFIDLSIHRTETYDKIEHTSRYEILFANELMVMIDDNPKTIAHARERKIVGKLVNVSRGLTWLDILL